MSYRLTVITPYGKIFDDQIETLSAPGRLGGFGVLSGHIPMVVALKAGALKFLHQAQEKYYAIASGILEINHDHNVLILCNAAQPSSNYDEALNHSKLFEKKVK